MCTIDDVKLGEVFVDLDEAALARIAELSTEREFAMGETICEAGDEATTLYILRSGAISLYRIPESGILSVPQSLHTADLSEKGDIIGWSALVPPYVYTLSASAVKDCRLIAVDGVRLREMLRQEGGTGYDVMLGVAKVIRKRLGYATIG